MRDNENKKEQARLEDAVLRIARSVRVLERRYELMSSVGDVVLRVDVVADKQRLALAREEFARCVDELMKHEGSGV